MTDSRLQVHPHCLMFFVDETGHEAFADPNHPVFGMGGCAVMMAALDDVVRAPWRAMKEEHFGGADRPLHASDLRSPSQNQVGALERFFRTQRFARFAVTLNADTRLPPNMSAYEVMAPSLRQRFQDIASRCTVAPVEIALIHEASERGDPLLERYFGPSIATIEGKPIKVHHAVMPKGDECLEVADFVVHAAGGQARRAAGATRRKDFEAVFHDPLMTSFIHIEDVTPNASPDDPEEQRQ